MPYTHILLALDLGELSTCMLWFLSDSLMCRRLFCLFLSVNSLERTDRKMDRDVRPTFHLEAGYPLSKHRMTNESDRQAQRSEAGSREL